MVVFRKEVILDDNQQIITLYDWIETLMQEKSIDADETMFRIQENLEIACQDYKDDHNEITD
jgi:hypothetical protein